MNTRDIPPPFRRRIKRAARKLRRRLTQFPAWQLPPKSIPREASYRSTILVGNALRERRKALQAHDRFITWLEARVKELPP